MGDKAKLTMSDLDALKYPFDKRTGYFQFIIYSDTDQAGVDDRCLLESKL